MKPKIGFISLKAILRNVYIQFQALNNTMIFVKKEEFLR